jgi:hypothetical protein
MEVAMAQIDRLKILSPSEKQETKIREISKSFDIWALSSVKLFGKDLPIKAKALNQHKNYLYIRYSYAR